MVCNAEFPGEGQLSLRSGCNRAISVTSRINTHNELSRRGLIHIEKRGISHRRIPLFSICIRPGLLIVVLLYTI
jgi:hypothetical protein